MISWLYHISMYKTSVYNPPALLFTFRYDDGRIIATQGQPPERFYYVVAGRGKIFELQKLLTCIVDL